MITAASAPDPRARTGSVMSSMFEDVPGLGWWGRPASGSGSISGAYLVLLGMRFADEDTLIYSAGIARADADRELDLKAGDLVFVMACSDLAAAEKHRDDPKQVALAAKFAEQSVLPENTFRRHYRTTGDGFLWRE